MTAVAFLWVARERTDGSQSLSHVLPPGESHDAVCGVTDGNAAHIFTYNAWRLLPDGVTESYEGRCSRCWCIVSRRLAEYSTVA